MIDEFGVLPFHRQSIFECVGQAVVAYRERVFRIIALLISILLPALQRAIRHFHVQTERTT